MNDMKTPQARELSRRLEVAREAAIRAGRIMLKYARTDFERETKADGSVVTIADRQSERLLRRTIEKSFPDDGVLGEEFGEKPGTTRYRWILDPLDGTLTYAQGVPLYGVLIGVEDRETESCPIGVIHIPALAETVYAQRGRGCTWERGAGAVASRARTARARVSQVQRLDQAVMLATDFWKMGTPKQRGALARLTARTRVQRTWADCYGYLLVATGRAEIMLDPVMKIWDAAPMPVILKEAGGCFTDWAGRPTIHGQCGVATNGRLHPAVLEELRIIAPA
jgi:histidinol phosphatase-like enzyme (inositol monophosphatase family)